jgi:hypothetical protein
MQKIPAFKWQKPIRYEMEIAEPLDVMAQIPVGSLVLPDAFIRPEAVNLPKLIMQHPLNDFGVFKGPLNGRVSFTGDVVTPLPAQNFTL